MGPEDIDLLRQAFPIDLSPKKDDAKSGICAWCGGDRRLDHALCKKDWFAIPASVRRNWGYMTLPERAKFIIENAPKGRTFP